MSAVAKVLEVKGSSEELIQGDDQKTESLEKTEVGDKIGIREKRHAAECEDSDAKRSKIEDTIFRKKKMAMLLVYSGKGYLGMQKNPGSKTIESDLLESLVKAGVVRPDHIEQPGAKMGFQRAARTDKGVSAAGQVVSLKMIADVDKVLEKINENLPSQIRVLGLIKTTKGFDSKRNCSHRNYIYITPTFALAPLEEPVKEDYRVTDEVLAHVQQILNMYKGTHNFHNFTSGKKPTDPSARRYIMEFTVGRPFVRDSLEYVVLTVKGQSFMLHQIRKMVGLMMAIVRGFAGIDTLKRSWDLEKVDIPKAPGLGLVLDKLFYDAYNKRFGNDGMHEAIDWNRYQEEIEKFKEEFIYPTIFQTERDEKSMLNWLATLSLHNYEYTEADDGNTLRNAKKLVVEAEKAAGNEKMSEQESQITEEKKDE